MNVPALTSLVSRAPDGAQGNGQSRGASVSADGRFVVFESAADNLFAGDRNGASDVFVKDLSTGLVLLVSAGIKGAPGAGASGQASISADGRFVVFESLAEDLVADDTNLQSDVFVRDLQTGSTTRASLSAAGVEASLGAANAAISANGRFVAFVSVSDNLVPGSDSFASRVYLKDLLDGSLRIVNTSAPGQLASTLSRNPSVSADGRYVAFETGAANLLPGDSNSAFDIYVKDVQTGAIIRASISPTGVQGGAPSTAATISDDGAFVVFQSTSTFGLADDTNLMSDVFRKNLLTGALDRVSVGARGAQLQDGAFVDAQDALSADGRYVVFQSAASNLVGNDTNGNSDLFIKDLLHGPIARVSSEVSDAAGNGPSTSAAISGDGRYIVFESLATDLDGDDTNALKDVFRVANPLLAPGAPVRSASAHALRFGEYDLELTGNAAVSGSGNTLPNRITGNDAANTLHGGGGDDTLVGAGGLDLATYDGPRQAYSVSRSGNEWTIADALPGRDGTDLLATIERLHFTDRAVALDILPTGAVDDPLTKGEGGNGGKAYRLYQAAFARTPDLEGLGYWIVQIDGGAKLFDLATGFLQSDEFKATYGNNPGNDAYTRALYLNVLGREPDANGYAYWNALLDGRPWNGADYGSTTRQQMLVDFSESDENKAQLAGIIGDGFDYLPWG